MLYKNEFCYLRPYLVQKKPDPELKPKKLPTRNLVLPYWKLFCRRSSMHGIKYLSDDDLRPFEKVIWLIVVVLAIFGTIYVSILVSKRFNSNNLATVVESTVFPVYQISFPAVTICNQNRINWRRLKEAEQHFMPNASKTDAKLFRRFVARLENFEFGNFDEFHKFVNVSLKPLDHINISALAESMAFRCEELFEEICWWRNRELPCCEIFMKQKSEFGFCYGFNSLVNDEGRQMAVRDVNWPWRTSTAGDWSGLRATIRFNSGTKRPGNVNPSGIMVIVHLPEEWPATGIFIPMGTASTVLLKPKVSYADKETRSISPEVRECTFEDEAAETKYKTFPGLKYLMANCISNCRQEYTVSYCNCTVEMFFPPGNYTPCKASDFHCLSEYDKIFNYEKVRDEDKFINSTGEGMVCSCLHECYYVDYQVEISPFDLAEDENNTDKTFLQVHYQRNTILKYRTNVVFGWMDLLVSFGGIAGLFLGSSLLSGFEILYHLTIGLVIYLEEKFKRKRPKVAAQDKWIWNTPLKPHKGKLNLVGKKIAKQNRWNDNKF